MSSRLLLHLRNLQIQIHPTCAYCYLWLCCFFNLKVLGFLTPFHHHIFAPRPNFYLRILNYVCFHSEFFSNHLNMCDVYIIHILLGVTMSEGIPYLHTHCTGSRNTLIFYFSDTRQK
jgi:hypothetical protein